MKNIKRIVAVVCIAALLIVNILALYYAVTENTSSMVIFSGLVSTMIFIPLVAYCFLLLHKYAMTRSGRKNYWGKSDDSSASDENINASSDPSTDTSLDNEAK